MKLDWFTTDKVRTCAVPSAICSTLACPPSRLKDAARGLYIRSYIYRLLLCCAGMDGYLIIKAVHSILQQIEQSVVHTEGNNIMLKWAGR